VLVTIKCIAEGHLCRGRSLDLLGAPAGLSVQVSGKTPSIPIKLGQRRGALQKTEEAP
jgi:hypothetical protein